MRVGGVQYGSAEWQACHVAQATPGCRQCHACHWVRRRQRSVATATQCNGAAHRQEPKACHPFRQKTTKDMPRTCRRTAANFAFRPRNFWAMPAAWPNLLHAKCAAAPQAPHEPHERRHPPVAATRGQAARVQARPVFAVERAQDLGGLCQLGRGPFGHWCG